MRPKQNFSTRLTRCSKQKMSQFFSDYSGNSRALKLNNAQTKGADITISQYLSVFGITQVLTGLVLTLSNHLSSLHYTSSQFLPNSLFDSASATDRVCHPLGSGGPKK